MDGDPTETWVTIFRPVNAVADLKVMKNTREEALEAAKNFLDQGLPFVTIVADRRVYTTEEFGMSIKRKE
jgi:hypothetical protein